MGIMQIFRFKYNDCIYESAMATISLHRTKKGAYNAMRNYLETDYAQWYNERILYGKERRWTDKYGMHCAWGVDSIELKE